MAFLAFLQAAGAAVGALMPAKGVFDDRALEIYWPEAKSKGVKMPETVMTMGRTGVTALLRGSSTAPRGGDFRDIPFTCQFSPDSVNSGPEPAPAPRILVTVLTKLPDYLFDVVITPPGGQREVLRRGSGGDSQVSWARRIVSDGDGPRAEPPPSTRRMIDGGWELDDPIGDIGDRLPVDPGGGASRRYIRMLDLVNDESGTWTVRVRHRDQDDQQFTITVDHPETVQRLHETRIPFQLINRAFAQALLSMQLRIHVGNGQARIQFDRTFRQASGVEDVVVSVSDLLQDINLQEFTVAIGNDAGVPTIVAGLDLEDRGDEIGLPYLPDINLEDLAISCRVRLGFGYPRGPDFFETAACRENGQFVRRSMNLFTYLDANPHIAGLWGDFLDWILVGTSTDEIIRDFLDAAERQVGGAINKAAPYFQDVIMHLVDRDAILFYMTADDDAIIVQHHPRPTWRDFFDGQPSPIDPGDVVIRTFDTVEEPAPSPAVTAELVTSEALAVASRSSARSHAGHLLREGDIDHIVVLMMENRSFDHMLGYRHFAHPEVNGLTGNESNPFSQGAAYDVHHLPVTAGLRSPDHGFGATLEQIADGAMSGFVQNYVKRSGVVDPGVVMGYYDHTDLPMYEFLANNFAICDAWHSAHLGETQCNRFATLTGTTPELENLELSDSRLGYYPGRTIFDYLSQEGIDWVYAEGNVAFLRMFDKYRIDVSHVIPYQDDFDQGIEDTFVNRVRAGNLPSVSFIDPRYIDVPPAWDANDDLPPADVCRGQQLISHLYSLLSNASTWSNTLCVVTYDEHGGFFDHQPPPGLPTSRDPSPFPRLHPNGPTHLGVRVPAFVISPWVDGGTIFHRIYDHTSILKTILQRFAPADFPVEEQFGARAAGANGLLTERLRTSPRRQAPPQEPAITCAPGRPTGPSAGLDSRDFHLSMRLLGVPAKYRNRAVVPPS